MMLGSHLFELSCVVLNGGCSGLGELVFLSSVERVALHALRVVRVWFSHHAWVLYAWGRVVTVFAQFSVN